MYDRTMLFIIISLQNHRIVGELSVVNILDQLVKLQPLIVDEGSYNLNTPVSTYLSPSSFVYPLSICHLPLHR